MSTIETAPRTVSVEDAARALGIGRSLAYELARRDELPVPVFRVGRLLRVPRQPLERLLNGEADGGQPAEAVP